MEYTPKTFSIPELEGISAKSVEEHLVLYQGYIKNFNAMSAMMPEYAKDPEKNNHALSEIIRRRSFEFDGMRLHELYFEQLEGGRVAVTPGSPFAKQIDAEYHKPEYFLEMFKMIAKMRGPGWAMLYFDPETKQFITGFSGEQHQGHFVGLPVILALDVWEHAYILDQGAAGRGAYIDAFFKNLNWGVIEKRFSDSTK